MKLLLDENLPTKLKTFFSEQHSISTVMEMKWSGKKNGELLKLMNENGFDGLVTLDKNLKFQQNLNTFNIQVIVLNAPDSKLATLQPYIAELEKRLKKQVKQTVVEISVD